MFVCYCFFRFDKHEKKTRVAYLTIMFFFFLKKRENTDSVLKNDSGTNIKVIEKGYGECCAMGQFDLSPLRESKKSLTFKVFFFFCQYFCVIYLYISCHLFPLATSCWCQKCVETSGGFNRENHFFLLQIQIPLDPQFIFETLHTLFIRRLKKAVATHLWQVLMALGEFTLLWNNRGMDKEQVTVFVAAQTQPGNVAVKLSQLLCMITTGGEIKKKGCQQ